MAQEGYAHPEYLVDAEWVDAHKDDANVVIVDCDVEVGFVRGHIPGSVLVPDNYEKNPDTNRVHLMNPEQFAAMCQGLGIGDDTLVIAYDNNQSNYAARLWWALNAHGHDNVKVLDGGWRRWVAAGIRLWRTCCSWGCHISRRRAFACSTAIRKSRCCAPAQKTSFAGAAATPSR